MRHGSLFLVLWAGLAAAQERPGQFAHASRIDGAGEDSHYRLTLPA